MGLCAALALTRVIASFLFGVKAWGRCCFCMRSSYTFRGHAHRGMAARRAGFKLDPIQALRAE